MQRVSDHGVPSHLLTSTVKLLCLRLRDHHRRRHSRIVAQDDQDICGEIVFQIGHGSCTQKISVTKLPEQDLHDGNTGSHASTDGGKSRGPFPT